MLITFEGPEGSGKSTQVRMLADWLRACGHSVIETREPGGTSIGDQIRHILHNVAHREMAATTEILLYSASRAQLVAELLLPNVDSHIIVSDRYFDSTLAYQGYGRGLPLDRLISVTNFATAGLKPDLTFFLDIEPRRGLARRLNNQEEMNRLDLESLDFHERVRAGYFELIAGDPQRWVVLNADRPVATIAADVRRAVTERLSADPE